MPTPLLIELDPANVLGRERTRGRVPRCSATREPSVSVDRRSCERRRSESKPRWCRARTSPTRGGRRVRTAACWRRTACHAVALPRRSAVGFESGLGARGDRLDSGTSLEPPRLLLDDGHRREGGAGAEVCCARVGLDASRAHSVPLIRQESTAVERPVGGQVDVLGDRASTRHVALRARAQVRPLSSCSAVSDPRALGARLGCRLWTGASRRAAAATRPARSVSAPRAARLERSPRRASLRCAPRERWSRIDCRVSSTFAASRFSSLGKATSFTMML